ncbi:MAG: hypothetical protein IJY20_02445 [Clostridia bacterium]|nr:hypothetical protein [Clostridia bacterium]
MVMEELRYTPRPVNHHARALSLVLLIVGALLFVSSIPMPAYGGILQLLALVLIVGALFIAYKFILSTYTYILTDPGNGIPCLLVEQIQGKRSSLVCHLPLHAITRILPAEKEPPRGKAHVYVATMRGGCYQYVLGRVDGTDILLMLEADETFMAALSQAAVDARRAHAEEE